MKRFLSILLLLSLAMCICSSFAVADTIDSIPVLSQTYPGAGSKLRPVGDRWYSRLGPGKGYDTSGGYKTDSQHKNRLVIFFNEDGWVYSDIVYSNGYERYAYLPDYAVEGGREMRKVYELDYVEATTNSMIVPSWGPSDSFMQHEDCTVTANSPIKVFFKENNYVLAEFSCAKGLARMWLPINKISFN